MLKIDREVGVEQLFCVKIDDSKSEKRLHNSISLRLLYITLSTRNLKFSMVSEYWVPKTVTKYDKCGYLSNI